ncbi:CxxxxCH/CxxCH domain-containing protein [Escherichia coli]|nr:CxxxxCH/CxxCH domain-containing protein [Escherichia coli]EKY6649239.1 CxxxxCH/CxxCH domain-containing protein [Escherichia coli]ELO3113766.1 CxxxxCH/CxxCH domain-containing protein [Escherichia coli]ELO5043757.1 CxxxxCH/CxxCH domain-containing protein [Escherichia coli]ELO5139106.1 CxxxxCH/CxxCH domain-containing protein [Escherichia coli]
MCHVFLHSDGALRSGVLRDSPGWGNGKAPSECSETQNKLR